MADAVTPSVGASAALAAAPAIPLLAELGLDPVLMFWALIGVVIVQTLVKRTFVGWLGLVGLSMASISVASVAAPIAVPLVLSKIPSDWDWMHAVHPVHIKAACAAVLGGFAQPLLIMAINRWKPAPPPATKEEGQ